MPEHRRTGQLDPELADRLNQHVSFEMSSAIAYFAMASWSEVRGLAGFVNAYFLKWVGSAHAIHREM